MSFFNELMFDKVVDEPNEEKMKFRVVREWGSDINGEISGDDPDDCEWVVRDGLEYKGIKDIIFIEFYKWIEFRPSGEWDWVNVDDLTEEEEQGYVKEY